MASSSSGGGTEDKVEACQDTDAYANDDDGGDWPDDDRGDWPDDDDDDDGDMMELLPDFMPSLELLRQVSEEEHASQNGDAGDAVAGDDATDDATELGEEKLADDTASESDDSFITPDGSRDLAWHQEVDALEAILGNDVVRVPDNSDELIRLSKGQVCVTLRPYCGELHLYENIEVECTFRQGPSYPDVPPRFDLSSEEGLSAAELFVLRNVMDECVRSLRVRRPGEPIIFDVVSNAQEFLAQKATFVTNKDRTKEAAIARRKAEQDRKAEDLRKTLGTMNIDTVCTRTVTIQSWVNDGTLVKFLPKPDELVKQLESASNDITWTVRSVVSGFLRERFARAMKTLPGTPQVAFHGTQAHNTASIAAHGLLVPGVKSKNGNKRIAIANGAAYGNGIYSSPYFSTAACYSGGSIFLCLVQLGTSNTGQEGWMSASHSGKFNSNVAGGIYVLFEAKQILPCLLLSYKPVPGTNGRLGGYYSSVPKAPNISQTIVSFVPAKNLNRVQHSGRSSYRRPPTGKTTGL